MHTPLKFFNRDLSWLGFNGAVLEEAAKPGTPLLERVNFLAIFSSNLDEFYRVRIPQVIASKLLLEPAGGHAILLNDILDAVQQQQSHFGRILNNQVIPGLQQEHIHLLYNSPLPAALRPHLESYFYNTLAAYLQINYLDNEKPVFLENNILYMAVVLVKEGKEQLAFLNIPSEQAGRFYTHSINEMQYIIFIDDIIKAYLPVLFRGYTVTNAYSIKVTRNAELDLADEFSGDMSAKIEAGLLIRDLGFATRVLYDPDMPETILKQILTCAGMEGAVTTAGGHYHNLKDFFSLPVNRPGLKYPARYYPAQPIPTEGIFAIIQNEDLLVHTPYRSYDTVLRFFNEAAIDAGVEEIYTTMYRVASNSKIIQALISAARNGKKVTVFVELKARFDEANNLKWAKVMKKAGVHIIYSIPGLKVHAKVTLVKRRETGRLKYYGLLSTGNFNEKTASIYTDHILLTANHSLLQELELLFIFLEKRRKPSVSETGIFKELLVSQFNLHQRFLSLIDTEIENARKGLPSGIRIKLNNLEEETLIAKLYEASAAGVQVQLIVRGICRLIPGVKGMSENIKVRRILGRYLEHGRVFVFQNNGAPLVFLGSADWMNRNIYNRIEVCFPLYNQGLRNTLNALLDFQWDDDDAQQKIYTYLSS